MTNDPHLATPSGKPRARSFGIPFDGEPGPANAITDVAGVTVGYTTLISGEGTLEVGKGPVRTGVTAILPRPREDIAKPVFAGIFSANGNGELTGSHLIEEIGAFNLPVTITNTHSCGVARDGTLRWVQKAMPDALDSAWALPVAGETYDGFLNDINGHHVTLRACRAGAGERGERTDRGRQRRRRHRHDTFGFKAGSGTASRVVEWQGERYTLGVFVQSNFGELAATLPFAACAPGWS